MCTETPPLWGEWREVQKVSDQRVSRAPTTVDVKLNLRDEYLPAPPPLKFESAGANTRRVCRGAPPWSPWI